MASDTHALVPFIFAAIFGLSALIIHVAQKFCEHTTADRCEQTKHCITAAGPGEVIAQPSQCQRIEDAASSLNYTNALKTKNPVIAVAWEYLQKNAKNYSLSQLNRIVFTTGGHSNPIFQLTIQDEGKEEETPLDQGVLLVDVLLLSKKLESWDRGVEDHFALQKISGAVAAFCALVVVVSYQYL